jgi:hypothetical protein
MLNETPKPAYIPTCELCDRQNLPLRGYVDTMVCGKCATAILLWLRLLIHDDLPLLEAAAEHVKAKMKP